MTVNTTNITSGPYSGNGVADAFSYTFRIENKNQLRVFETDDAGVETELTVDTDYTVAGVGNDAGGTVTRVAGALPSGYTWYIRSNYVETQVTDFQSQGAFFPQIHESAMDKLTFLIQQITDIQSRSMRLRDSYSGAATTGIPDPEALKFLRWNAAGTGFENTFGTTSAVGSDVSTTDGDAQNDLNTRTIVVDSVADIRLLATSTGKKYITTLGYSARGDGGGAFYWYDDADTTTADDGFLCIIASDGARWKLNHGGEVNVKWAGAKGDGVTDDSAAIQAALNAAAKGDRVVAKSGAYKINTALTIPDGVVFAGPSRRPFRFNGDNFASYPGRLILNPAVTINMKNDSTLSGFVIVADGITVPANAAAVATWAGTAITVNTLQSGATIADCFIGGFNRAIDTAVGNTPKVTCTDLYIDCRNGVRIQEAFDVCYLTRVHCWPAFSVALSGVTDADKERDGNAFEFVNTVDWVKATDCFSFGFNRGFIVNGVNSAVMKGCSADNVTANTVNPDSIGFLITGASAEAALIGCQAADHATHGFYIDSNSTASNTRLIGCTSWSNGSTQIAVVDGVATITNCVCRGEGVAQGISVSGSDRVTLRDNVIQSCSTAINNAAGQNVIEDGNVFISCTTGYSTRYMASIVSAGTITLDEERDVFEITGTATIGTINRAGGYKGKKVTLLFRAALNVVTTGNIKLAGGATFAATADDTLTLLSDGTNWIEVARSVN